MTGEQVAKLITLTIRYRQEDTFSIYPRPKHYLQILSIGKKSFKSGAPQNSKRTVQILYTRLFTLTYQHTRQIL